MSIKEPLSEEQINAVMHQLYGYARGQVGAENDSNILSICKEAISLHLAGAVDLGTDKVSDIYSAIQKSFEDASTARSKKADSHRRANARSRSHCSASSKPRRLPRGVSALEPRFA